MTLESIVELMHGDKSNDWSEEITTLSDHLLRGMREAAEHVRVECREADPEVWAEADHASAAAALS